jgi:predicted nuclease of restriction endonuclease-like (RecB) superfamily
LDTRALERQINSYYDRTTSSKSKKVVFEEAKKIQAKSFTKEIFIFEYYKKFQVNQKAILLPFFDLKQSYNYIEANYPNK